MSDKTLKQKQQTQNKEKQAYAFYIAKGYTPEQAIGIVGNLKRESNFNTTVVGTADNKKSQGIAQWHSDRLKTLKNKYGDNWTDFNNQLEFVDWELRNTHKAAGDKLRNSKGVWESAKVVSDDYERPKVKFAGDETRQRYVSDLAMKFKGVKLTPEDMPYANASYANSVAPYMNQPTPTINNFDIPKQTTTFASVPDSVEKEETKTEEDKDVAEVEQKTKEFNFLDELNTTVPAFKPREKQQIEAPQTDYMQQYEQISQFIENPQVAQQGKKFKLQDERNLVVRDNTPNTKRDLSLMLAEYNNAKKDEQELRTTGQIKNPNSIQYRRNIKTQPDIKQDNISTEQRNAPLNPLQRPLIYLANPEKVLGDLGVPNMETSELDRQAINANKFNPYQSGTDRFVNNAKIGLGYVPEAAINTALAAAFMPEGSGALGLVNEALNPLAGIRTNTSNYFTNPTEKVTTSLKDNLKSLFSGRDIMKPSNLIPKEELDDIINRELNYVKSKEYISNRVKNTGEKIEDIEKEISQYEKYLDEAQINIDEGVSGGSYYRPNNIVRAGAKGKPVNYTKGVVQHEVGHLLSPIGLNEKAYKNFPIIDFEPKFSVGNKKYNMLPEEQQVRNNKIKTYMEDIYGKKRGSEFNDEDIKNLLGENDFNSIDYNPYYEDASNFIKDIKHSNPTNYKDLLKEALNKSWATLPIAGASYLATQGQEQNPPQYQQGGNFTENELAFLSEIAIKDNNGYWNKNNQGKVIEIDGGNITMKGVDQDLIGISKQTGEKKIMKPNKNYTFSNTKSVIEIPFFKK